MAKCKANLRHGAIIACLTHKRKRVFKPKAPMPTNKCPACWACWLADHLETSLYEDDIEALLRFARTVPTTRATSIEYTEEKKDDE